MNAVPLPDLVPGTLEWMKRMTASKVAAVLGLSPWESRFSLWHRMAGLIDPQPETDQTRRGHYLEDAVCQWFQDQHPEWWVLPGGAWEHPERPWQAASPDRVLAWVENEQSDGKASALLEVKTSADMDEWGDAGTDDIPPYYRAQVMWQLDTLGLPTAYVAVLLPRLEFREYRIDYNPAEAEYIRDEARAFLDSLPGGTAEQRPDIDAHSQTYIAVRELHPGQPDGDVQVPDDLALRYCMAVKLAKKAAQAEAAIRNELADFMGDARRALWLGKSIATRQQRNGGTPFLKAATTFPTLTEETAA